MKIIFLILTLFSFNIFADDHDDVLAAVEKYYEAREVRDCLLYTSPSPRDRPLSRMPSSA